jgi:hypothetical protein
VEALLCSVMHRLQTVQKKALRSEVKNGNIIMTINEIMNNRNKIPLLPASFMKLSHLSP